MSIKQLISYKIKKISINLGNEAKNNNFKRWNLWNWIKLIIKNIYTRYTSIFIYVYVYIYNFYNMLIIIVKSLIKEKIYTSLEPKIMHNSS